MDITPARRKYWDSLKGRPHGHKTSNGKHWTHPPAFREKMREIALADGRKPSFLGRKHSDVSKEKMSQKSRDKNARYWLGKDRSSIFTEEYRKKMSIASKKVVAEGRHNFWKGGKTASSKIARTRLEYKLWREAVFRRDDFTCQICGERGRELNADHIKPFSTFPELRYETDNGRTLCKPCHKNTDTYGRKALIPN